MGGGVGGAIALSGGGDEAPDAAPTLSAAEYREQGNRICGLSQARLDDLLAAVPGTPTAQTVRNAVELYLNSTVAERLNGLRGLAPPAPLATDHEAVLANQEEQREIFRGLVAQLDEGAAPGAWPRWRRPRRWRSSPRRPRPPGSPAGPARRASPWAAC